MREMILCILLMFSGCTVGPSYQRPGVETPAAWTISYDQAADLTNSRWWSAFGDPVLDGLVEQAVRGNLDLGIAAARVDQYLAALSVSRSQLYPQTGGSATALTQRRGGVDGDSFELALNAGWELDIWGRVRKQGEAAKAELLASDAGRRVVLMSVVGNVVGQYFVLRGLDRQLEIARETETAYAERLRIFQLRFTHGTISQVQLSQAESQYASARKAIPQLESLIRQQENLLALLLGRPPGAIARGSDIDSLTPPAIPPGLPSQLLERRPDIVQAEELLKAANARIGVAKAAYYPAISLTGLLGTVSDDLEGLFGADSETASLAGNAVLPLFTFGRIAGQVGQAEAVERQTDLQYRQTVMNAFREVEDALIKVNKGEEQLKAEQDEVRSNGEYARLARLQFEAGTADYLVVVDADRALFSSQLALVESRTDVLVAMVSLYKAMGGGWVDAIDPVAGDNLDAAANR